MKIKKAAALLLGLFSSGKEMSLRMKLIIYFSFIVLFMVVIGYIGFIGTNGVFESFDRISDHTSPALLALGKIEASVHRIGLEAVSFTLIHAELKTAAAAAAAAAAEIDELEEAKETLDYWENEYDKVADHKSDERYVDEIEKHEVAYYNAAIALVNGKKEGKSGQEILDLRDLLGQQETAFVKLINKIIESERNELHEQDQVADALVVKTKILILMVTILAIIISIFLIFFLSMRVTRTLTKLTNTVNEVSQGNFKVDIEKTGNIKEINDLTDSLQRVMTTMKFAVKQTKKRR
jgi:methyl-accepting chemotaxis protein